MARVLASQPIFFTTATRAGVLAGATISPGGILFFTQQLRRS